MNSTEPSIVDDVEHRRFVFRQNGLEAELTYRVNGTRLILVHTEVPVALRGRGVAGNLVHAAVERASSSGETLVPWCPYVRKWLGEHPEVDARVTIDWTRPPALIDKAG